MPALLRVLILEDRPSDVDLMLHQLKRSGFDPQWKCVEREEDYLAQLAHQWDVILSDYHMPQFTAKQALHLLRERKMDIPFIVVTGTVGEDVAVAMMREGATDYLLKDRLARLGEAVRNAVEQHQMRQRKRETEQALVQEHILSARRTAELEVVLDAVPAAVFIAHDPQGRRITGNRMARGLFGVPPQANLSKSAPPEEKPENFKVIENGREIPPEQLPLQRAAQGREIRDHEEDLVFTNGTIRTIFGNAMPLWDEQGRPRGAVGAFIDITERKQAEKSLRDSEERLRLTLQAAMMGSFEIDLVTGEGQWNSVMFQLLGIKPGDVPSTPEVFFRFVHPDDLAGLRAQWEEATRTGTLDAEFRIVRPDGQKRWLAGKGQFAFESEVSGNPEAKGRSLRFLGVNYDITERKQAEESLAAAHGQLQSIIDNTSSIIYAFDLEHRFLLANTTLAEMLNTTLAQLIGKSRHEFMPQEDADWHEANDLRVIEAGKVLEFEEYSHFKDRSITWLTTKFPLRDAQGRIYAVAGISVDISVRKQAEEALRESEERLRETIESIPSLIWTARPDGWVDYLNHRWLGYTGQPAEAVLGSQWMNFLHPDDLEKTKREWEQAVAEGHDYEVEQRLRGANGSYCWFVVRATPLRDAQGRIMKWYGTNFDIADRKQAEEAMRTAMLAAEQANRAKDQFMAVLSHELRTPLTPVLAAVDLLLKDTRHGEETRQSLDMIHRNVELEARLIDDLLDINRIAHGKVELNKQPVDLCEVIQRAVEVCKEDITVRRLHFGVELEQGPYWVEADVVRLQQVFWNLLKNAIKFTPPGGCVGIYCHHEDGQVIAEVRDSGIGIEPEVLKRIFSAFEQGEKSLIRQFGGLGLGLTISKSLVQLHGGTIEACSEGREKGATFRVYLPMISAPPVAPRPRPTSEAAPSSKQSLRILLVEDNGDTARMIRRLLVRAGHQVHLASDVATGMELARRNEFDLLLSDLGLPDGSGYDLMRTLRSRGQTLPGIALSGYGQEQDILQSREAGFAEHLVKPVNIDRLLAAIQHVAGNP